MHSKPLRSYKQIYPYLTAEAKRGIKELHDLGIKDEDLAITVLELLMDDEEMYDLPNPEES